MLLEKRYDRERAVLYARRWALSRNPLFADFTGLGGNCTNFVSQCLYAGGCVMNFTPVYGWYYVTQSQRTASWTGVSYFYDFLTGNEGEGPYAEERELSLLLPGDVIQLGGEEGYYHTLLCVGRDGDGVPLVAAQTDDALDRPLSTYRYGAARGLHILGVRMEVAERTDCYEGLYGGTELLLGDAVLPPTGEGEPSEVSEENSGAGE